MTTWTDETKPTTTHSAVSGVSTTWAQLNPPGFGFMPFGDPTGTEFQPEMRGFGDPKTHYTKVEG